MSNLKTVKNIFWILLITCCFSMIVGCASSSRFASKSNANFYKAKFESDANNLLAKAESTQNESEKLTLLIEAGYLFAKADNLEKTSKIVPQIANKKINNPTLANKVKLTRAKFAVMQNNTDVAAQILGNISIHSLSLDLQRDFHLIKSQNFYNQGNVIPALNEIILANKLTNNDFEIKQSNQMILGYLDQLTPNQLNSLQQTPNISQELRGWLSFGYLNKQYDAKPDQVVDSLKQWQQDYPYHAANAYMPNLSREENVAYSGSKPSHIALLLPLSSAKYSRVAQTIKNGFISAMYDFYPNPDQVPTVKIYDTNKEGVITAYNNAVANGAQFIIGPLTKENVNTLYQSGSFSVPVLALNATSNTGSAKTNFFEFGLMPENEAMAAASKARSDGFKNALVIVPNNEWGNRIVNAFNAKLTGLGGSIVGKVAYDSSNNLNDHIQRALGIQYETDSATGEKKSGNKVTAIPQRRRDVDFIFIATSPETARQIKPLLNFHFAANLPVYAISSIYSGTPAENLDQDLNGIIFCDIPWVLDNDIQNKKIHQTIASKWPSDYRDNPRLFALGIDAYKLSQQLGQLKGFSSMGVSGMTGVLTLNNDNVVERRIMWAKFRNGRASML